MLMTPEKLAANQANSQRSTGPKTEAGKRASSRNSLKHGMTGAGLALPDEDAAQIELAFNQHFDEMKPRTQAGATIVYKVALCKLRIERFGQAEAATLSQLVIDAGFVFDDAQFDRRDSAKAKLFSDPPRQLAALSRFQIGVEWVIDAWESLACALYSGKIQNWRQPQYDLFEALTGHSTEFRSYDDSTLFNLAVKGDAGALDNPNLTGDSPAARWQCAREKLLSIYEEESARWEGLLEPATAATAVARANAIKAARYDGSKEGLLAKKYEAATTRELNKALKDFAIVEAEFSEPEQVVETPVKGETCVEVGSFFPDAEPTVPEAESEPIAMVATNLIADFEVIEASLTTVEAPETGENLRL